MHDPSTVAFDIKYPWPRGAYRRSLITVWHEDPLDFTGKCGARRNDDSCGWFTPTYSQAEKDRIAKLGRQEWSTVFGQRAAIADKKDYWRVCYEPTDYDAIYWTW